MSDHWHSHFLLIFLCIIIFFLSGHEVHAFGAGNIPSFAYLEGKAFRHGDIEDTLGEMVKRASGGFALGALIGKGGTKFKQLDVKRVYFGNWLRDYSQAVDVASLKKLQLQTIIDLIMVLGFMAHGYATDEFEVTRERLGVYLPTEHIDNPKGYPTDARNYDGRLRGPVDPREVEIDRHTGMKNYIANENGSWDTSKALVRRTLNHCIQLGRRYRAQGLKEDEYESYRLLGQALHTLEDFTAHSNFCELALVSLGSRDVFVHVGDSVRLHAPDGRRVAPLVTGTFGSSDFIHSLLGEASDHITQASVVDLNSELDKARTKSLSGSTSSSANILRGLFFKLPDGSGGGEMEREMEGVERTVNTSSRRPEEMSPQELHQVLWQVLSFRDSVMKKISIIIEKIPGLSALVEKISDSISVFVFTTLEPFLKPIMKQATTGLSLASGEVIDNSQQYEVFDNPLASDPTHSFLSKDHFNLILNEPAGNLAKIIVAYTVPRIVKAWEDPSINIHQVTEDILHCMFHPDFHDRNSAIQREMIRYMQSWVQSLGNQEAEVLRRLTKNSVRNHLNIRIGSEGQTSTAQGTIAQTTGLEVQNELLSTVPGLSQASALLGKISGAASSGSRPVGSSGYAGNAMSSTPPELQAVQEIPSHQNQAHTAAAHHHQHHRTHQQYYVSSSQGAAHYADSETIRMPEFGGMRIEQAAYSTTAGYPDSSSYAPPPGPPGFPDPVPAAGGYTPSYMSGYGAPPDPGFPAPGSAYGAYAPPAGPPRSSPGFPDAFPAPHQEGRHHQNHHSHNHHGHHSSAYPSYPGGGYQ